MIGFECPWICWRISNINIIATMFLLGLCLPKTKPIKNLIQWCIDILFFLPDLPIFKLNTILIHSFDRHVMFTNHRKRLLLVLFICQVIPNVQSDYLNSWHKWHKMAVLTRKFSIYAIKIYAILCHFMPFYAILCHWQPPIDVYGNDVQEL